MKKLLVALLLWSSICNGQDSFRIDFESYYSNWRVLIDTSIENNSWQIGAPQKEWLSDPNSQPNVLITDTIESYPINDSSVFSFLHVRIPIQDDSHHTSFAGYYKSDCDTLADYCTIELSPNNGKSWIDLLTDDHNYWGVKPTLTGKTEWTEFWIDIEELTLYYELEDSIIFRFTFISDNNDSQRGGIMFDDFWVNEFFTGIDLSSRSDILISVYPNPTQDVLNFEIENSEHIDYGLRIYNNIGQLNFAVAGISLDKFEIDISNFEQGIYTYLLSNSSGNCVSSGKFIIQ